MSLLESSQGVAGAARCGCSDPCAQVCLADGDNSSQPGRLCWNDSAACKTEIWASVQTVFFFPHRLETSFKNKGFNSFFYFSLSCELLQVTFKLKVATLELKISCTQELHGASC